MKIIKYRFYKGEHHVRTSTNINRRGCGDECLCPPSFNEDEAMSTAQHAIDDYTATKYGAPAITYDTVDMHWLYQGFRVDNVDGEYMIKFLSVPYSGGDSLESALYQIKHRAEFV